MTDNLFLLTNGKVRLVVMVRAVTRLPGLLATCFCLFLKVVRLLSAFVHEEGGQIQITTLARRVAELDQREFDLLAPAGAVSRPS